MLSHSSLTNHIFDGEINLFTISNELMLNTLLTCMIEHLIILFNNCPGIVIGKVPTENEVTG